LWQAGADEVEFEQPHDVLLAFSLLESLTEDELSAFLKRARPFTRQALFSVIKTTDHELPKPQYASDQDLSHITLRSTSWWHDLLTGAGWRQDAVHRLAQRRLQSHPLPARMGWSLFIYSP
jgi:hypothetical protein